MKHTIESVAVIGSGVMGSRIAAHMANAGIKVILMDLPSKGLFGHNAIADEAVERLLKDDPAPLMHKSKAKNIETGNTDELKALAQCDWIIEAIVEKKAIKQDLYTRILKHAKKDAVISSNTSTIPLADLVSGMDGDFKKRFMITHFFNPPRYMRLLEVVKGPETSQEAYDMVCAFASQALGKTPIVCEDTPGFIANRIGTFWIQYALRQAIEHKITVEEADALLGKPMGIPKTGVFALMDLVGLDLMPLIAQSMNETLPKDDLYRTYYTAPDYLEKMIQEGYTGRKGKGGFYRLVKDEKGKRKEALCLQTGAYRPTEKPRLASLDVAKEGLLRLMSFPDKGGLYAKDVMTTTLWYAAHLYGQVSHDIHAMDQAMKLGYNWKKGPFELMDAVGLDFLMDAWKEKSLPCPDVVEKAHKAGGIYGVHDGICHVFDGKGQQKPIQRPAGQLLLEDVKRRQKPLLKNASAALWDLGDGVTCFELNSKMNAIDPMILGLLLESVQWTQDNAKAMVIHTPKDHFSAGANLGFALFAINLGLWSRIEDMLDLGQKAYQSLKYAPFPVVGAPSGMALGGGCEILLHCDAIESHSELYMGLVEVGVGLVPAWGGCKEMLVRCLGEKAGGGGSMAATKTLFELIGTAKVAKSAFEAKEFGFLRQSDGIIMNRDWLLTRAKERALEMVPTYAPPSAPTLSLPGAMARVAFSMAVKAFVKAGKATPYDQVVSEKLANVLSGGDTDVTDAQTEENILALEKEAFMALIHRPETLARMEHILKTGKPLRN